MKKKTCRLTAREIGHDGSPNTELHHLLLKWRMKVFSCWLAYNVKEYMEKVSRNNCSTLLVISSRNVYKAMWLMVICHRHRLSKEEKANIQHFYHHMLHCQKKTGNLKLAITPYRARSCQILEQPSGRSQKKSWLAGQVEKISPKQKPFSKTCINKRVHPIFIFFLHSSFPHGEECRAERRQKESFSLK